MRDIPILSINGSDSSGRSGIQADIQTIAALGGYALTAISCVGGYALPTDVLLSQVNNILTTLHPRAIKIGLLKDCETIRFLRDEVVATNRLVLAPGIFDAEGTQMVSDDVIDAVLKYLLPEALLLMLRQKDAEKLLGLSIRTDEDMIEAAKRFRAMGAEWVLLRGARHTPGRLTALLFGKDTTQFFTSYNTEGWQRHGVAGALSAAITTRLGMGDDIPTAIRNAHDFIHSQVVYAKENDARNRRSIDLYNAFVSLVAEYYRDAHDVRFYADKLCITTRYLSGVTDKVVGKTPKQIIADYLVNEAKNHLATTRLTIQEIADKLGFSSQALFCKFFKVQESTSPSAYRNQMK